MNNQKPDYVSFINMSAVQRKLRPDISTEGFSKIAYKYMNVIDDLVDISKLISEEIKDKKDCSEFEKILIEEYDNEIPVVFNSLKIGHILENAGKCKTVYNLKSMPVHMKCVIISHIPVISELLESQIEKVNYLKNK